MGYQIVSIINGSRSDTPFQQCTMLESVRLRCFQTLCSLLASVAVVGFAATCSDDHTVCMARAREGEKGSERREEEGDGDVQCLSPLYANSRARNLRAQSGTHDSRAYGVRM